MSATFTRDAFPSAAWMLATDIAAIKAVAEVESGPYGAFLDGGSEPTILFEPHYFHQFTGGKYDKTHPKLSYPKWKPGQYGKMSEQHDKLAAAAKLDREAALKSCSWGAYQIMGANYRRAGFGSVQSMVTAAYKDADSHLRMFVNFILSDERLVVALRAHDWRTFARNYNGAGFEANKYDVKMAAAYTRLIA